MMCSMNPKSKRWALAMRSDKITPTEHVQADAGGQTQEKTSTEPRILCPFACDDYDNVTVTPQSPG